eukprot:365942-Chlamydomonas_euryale.AAC.65
MQPVETCMRNADDALQLNLSRSGGILCHHCHTDHRPKRRTRWRGYTGLSGDVSFLQAPASVAGQAPVHQ